MIRALTAIPPSPSRCRDLLPAFSTRNSWRTRETVMCCSMHTNTSGRGEDHTDVTHRNNSEDGVDDSSTDGGIDGLFHTS